ncbi:MAG TPA: protein kinase [Thermoanaerobaculia bacterium]|nr:protein kinase [Thermoanaerobaculia bacterium]
MPLGENAMLGPYRIVGLIGEGGMGAVYRAKDTRLGRDVAVKVLTAVTMSDKERLARFEQEARATGMLNHPNLLTIYDVGSSEGAPFLVSELLEGETLRERLNRGAMTPRKAVEASLQMAQGLSAAHDKGIVHRDLKPDNIFLTREGRVKILDFGIAKLSATASSEGPAFHATATEPGMVLGTVGYMSPEQVRGEPVDHRSDIFAFGAILYEMLSGSRAFKRSSSIETLSAILKEEPPELADTHPNIPSTLDRLVKRCLEKDREQRFQSARDLAFNLDTLSSVSQSAAFSGPAPVQVAEPTAQTPTAARAAAVTARQPLPVTTTGATTAALPRTAQQPAAARTSGAARPKTAVMARPKARRVSPVLLMLLYLVSIGGAGFAGWYLADRMHTSSTEASFRRITFRRGEVRSARFTPDGDTIVYSAAWDGAPSSEIYVASRQSPEARPLGIADADVLAVSPSTELAVLLRRNRITGIGTLARVPLAGGMPREVADNVLQADWSSDGAELAIIRVAGNQHRIEYPIGTVRYSTPHYLRDIRVSPDGSRVAFIEPHGGENDVVVLATTATPEAIARGWSNGATGLAWSSDGEEIWITGTSTGAPPSLYAVPLEGEPRLVDRLTGSMKLFDISRAGRVLLSNGMWRAALLYQPPGEPAERDMSWLDWSVLADLSPDGRSLLFNETREGGGDRSSIYLRRMDEPAPIRIGEGYGDGLSPDGRWVLTHAGAKLVLMPTGSGEGRELQVAGAFDVGAAWLPDSRRAVIGGALPNESYRLLLLDTLDETVKPLSPENIWGGSVRPFAVSPDGKFVAGMTAEETIALYATDGSARTVIVGGVEKGEVPIQWSGDGSAIYVYSPTALPARVFRVTLATGARQLWREFAPSDPAGVYKIAPVFMTTDAAAYAYNALRTTSDLYVAEGLK